MFGNTLKDAKYLKRIKDATTATGDPGHPRHHAIKMQAHHVISADGVKKSGLGKELVEFGYDINLLPNLTFIPSTLQGACHLSVQPHRGNHAALIENDESDDDSDHPIAYHDLVKTRVKELKRLLIGECPAGHPGRRAEIREEMDRISKDIVKKIQYSPARAPLTKIAQSFAPDSKNGCGGTDSVTSHNLNDCPVERNHENQQGPDQRKEQITYKRTKPYILKAGR
jgi:hypothetical protein